MIDRDSLWIVGTPLYESVERRAAWRARLRRGVFAGLILTAAMLLGAALAHAEPVFRLEPIALTLTSSTPPRLLTLSEADLYRINARALALAQGYRVELSLCSDRLDDATRERDDLERRIMTPAARAVSTGSEDVGHPWWVWPVIGLATAGGVAAGVAIGVAGGGS